MSIQHRKTNNKPDEKPSEETRAVIVIGQRRSGTSMLAGILDYLGVSMGVENGGQITSRNRKGFYEDKEFDRILQKVLNDYRDGHGELRWNKWRYEMKDDINRHIATKKGIWGFKNPNLPIFFPLIEPYLKNFKILLTFRNPLSIAQSIIDWHNKSPIEAIVSVYWQEGLCIKFLERPNAMPIAYENVLINPDKNIEQIINFLDIKPTEEQKRSAKDFIDIKLKHF